MDGSENNYAVWKKPVVREHILRIRSCEMLETLETTHLCYSDKKSISGCLGLVVNRADGLGRHKHNLGGGRKGLHFYFDVV